MGIDAPYFQYLVTDFRRIYKEDYCYDPVRDMGIMKEKCGELIDFIERNRSLITDKKIFGGDNGDNPGERRSEKIFMSDAF
jgi:hypothetical protein